MSTTASFDQALDVIGQLTWEQQADLIDVLQRRLAEQGRQRIADDAASARTEHAAGHTRIVSVEDLMREIES